MSRPETSTGPTQSVRSPINDTLDPTQSLGTSSTSIAGPDANSSTFLLMWTPVDTNVGAPSVNGRFVVWAITVGASAEYNARSEVQHAVHELAR